MDITMNDSRIVSITQLRSFLKGSLKIPFSLAAASVERKYDFLEETLQRFSYRTLKRRDKRILKPRLYFTYSIGYDSMGQDRELVNKSGAWAESRKISTRLKETTPVPKPI